MTDALFSTTSLHTFGGASFAVFLIVQVLHRVPGIKQVAIEWLAVGVGELLFLSTTRPFPASVAGWIVLGLNGLLSASAAIGGGHLAQGVYLKGRNGGGK
ncbi:hypothetical protein D2Q93_04330 [Alicyclobacillaceae bacterium I2511]|nr:hypothetical protein D2Q93_04330 [Alicyclobacillaceae bacterium I2511]